LRVSPGPPPPGLARGHAELATVLTRLLPRLGFDPRRDVQVLAPVRAGHAGTTGLNAFLQTVLNPPGGAASPFSSPSVDLPGGGVARVGDRVMQTVNDREADVCNGDVGVVVSTGPGARLAVAFSGGGSGGGGGGAAAVPRAPVVYDGPDALARLDLAWAATVHKAQGSEAPAAVLVLDAAAQARPALTRRLLYTALTRARRCVVVVGDDASIAAALAGGGAVGSAPRRTGLRGRLATALGEGGGGGGGGSAAVRPPADPPLADAA
jgi:exodeoxyribonuclease V alpha subunit